MGKVLHWGVTLPALWWTINFHWLFTNDNLLRTMINDALKYRTDQRQGKPGNIVFKGSVLLEAGFCVHNSLLNIDQMFFASVVLWLRYLSQGMSPLLNWVIFSVKMTGIALLPVKGDVRPLYGYISWGLALQGLMLPRTVSIGGNPSALRQAKKPRVQATFTMWILLCDPPPPFFCFFFVSSCLVSHRAGVHDHFSVIV